MSKFGWHFQLLLLAVTLGVMSRAAGADPGSAAWDWGTRAPVFDPEYMPTDTPILLYFDAQWCGFCKQMDRTTLSDQTVRMKLAMLVHVKLDFDEQEELVKRFAIDGVPAFLLVNERGEEISRSVGATSPVAFVNWLEAGEKRAAEIASDVQKRRLELRQFADQAASTDPAIQATVRQRAFDMLGRGEPLAQKFATDYLGNLARTHPESLLDGLAYPDLAVRIAVANILRSKLGVASEFDPWAGADERKTRIERLREEIIRNAAK